MRASITLRASLLAFGRIAATVSTFLLSFILVRVLSKEAVGTYGQVWMVVNTVTSVLAFGLPTSIYYFLPRLASEQKRAFIAQTLVLLAALGVVAAAAVYLEAPRLALVFANPGLVLPLRITCVMLTATLPLTIAESTLVSLGESPLLAKLTVASRALFFVLAIIPLLWGAGLPGVMGGIVVHGLLQALVFSAFMLRRAPGGILASWALQREQLRFSVPLGVTGLAGVVSSQLDKWMVSLLGTTSQFATYWVGAFEIPFIGIITGAISDALMPDLVILNEEREWPKFLDLWHRAITKVAMYLLPLMVYLMVFSREVISVVYSRAYIDSALPFFFFLFLIPTRFTSFGQILVALGRPQLILSSSIAALFANALLIWVLFRLFGVVGPALATVLVTYALALYLLNAIRVGVKANWGTVWPWRDLLRLLGFSVAAIVPTLWTKLAHLNDITTVAVSGLVYAAIGGLLYWRTGRLDSELQLLRRVLTH